MGSKVGPPPNYYAILGVSETATAAQIRDAYKRAALKTHPDRIPTDHPERASRTRRFQLVNDAYYTLSDPARRREYDAERKLYSGSGARSTASSSRRSQMPGGFGGGSGNGGDPFAEAEAAAAAAAAAAGSSGGSTGGIPFSWAWEFFTGGQKPQQERQQERERTEQEQFADVFEEMLREQGMAAGDQEPAGSSGTFWSLLGGLSGGALGFIVANVPGMVAGAVAGNRLGAVRDTKGKSVYAVFQELPQNDKAKLLSQLAAKVLSHAAAGV
ncbi:hypothetical protein VTH82DRAFT_3200 [Thermothelomyces myriococcoides]